MTKLGGLMSKLNMFRARVDNLQKQAMEVRLGADENKVKTFVANCQRIDEFTREFSNTADQIVMNEHKGADFDESEFFIKVTEFDDIIAGIRVALSDITIATGINSSESRKMEIPVKLPAIALPTFKGSVAEWTSYYSLFKSLVAQNTALTDVERLHYLRTSVQGEPLDLIKGLDICDVNYAVAIQLLEDRYANMRKIATAHADRLMSFSSSSTPSAKHLRSLIAAYRENVDALRAINAIPQQFKGTTDGLFLFIIMVRKLDPITRCQFERSLNSSKEVPTPDQLVQFLETECQALEAGNECQKPYKRFEGPKTTTLASEFLNKCMCCNSNNHSIYSCEQYLARSVPQRRHVVQQKRLCFNCLRKHCVENCTSKSRCSECKGKHHTTLHYMTTNGTLNSEHHKSQVKGNIGDKAPVAKSTDQEHDVVTCAAHSTQGKNVLLSTVVVGIQDGMGRTVRVKGLLDCGSQANYITARCVQRLRLKQQKTDIRVSGLAQQGVSLQGVVSLNVSNRRGDYIVHTNALILKKITGKLPTARIPQELRELLGSLYLADPDFDTPGEIECLLGAEVYAQCIKGGRHSVETGGPVAIETLFGWTLMGAVRSEAEQNRVVSYHAMCEESLDTVLHRFWEIEEPEKTVNTKEDECERHFQASHTRSRDGKYVVRLPFKESPQRLGSSFEQAKSRFLSVERRLLKQADTYQLYKDFMQDYIDNGHMEECLANQGANYYLPHHGVMKPSSSTTKLRVVFDASAKTSSGSSLNDILHSGPKLQNDIMEVLLRFRTYPIAFTADIKQMFRQVWVHPDDRKYQLILWRPSPEEHLKTYQLKTVTFGVTSSPYLAMRSLKQLAQDEEEGHEIASQVLMQDIFVDDIVTGAQSIQEARILQRQLTSVLAKGGFQLRKWTSNCMDILDQVLEEHREVPISFADKEGLHYEVLGVGWQASSDNFIYRFEVKECLLTKRGILSTVARFYDPTGYLTPVIFWAKTLLQQLWFKGIDWDTHLPSELKAKWENYIRELPLLSEVRIPRFVGSKRGELHGFSDASERGYAGVVYFRPDASEAKPVIIIAKSKVAPIKQISLPRLELCGAYLLAKLLQLCCNILGGLLNIVQIFAWIDSTTVLSWIHTPPCALKTFVSNRVSSIQQWVPPARWRHVPSALNPADCASRGFYPSQLVTHTMWFTGPPFLLRSPEEWPESKVKLCDTATLPERKLNPLNTLVSSSEDTPRLTFLLNYSSWLRTLRVTAYVLRFVNNTRHPHTQRTGPLSSSEVRIAMMAVLRSVQLECFEKDIVALRSQRLCSTRLQRLSPFLDPAGLIRVGGRIQNANTGYSHKHPIVLPKKHHVVSLIINHYHQVSLHAGPRLLQSILARNFWIIAGRTEIRKVIYQCIVCFRHRPRNATPQMAVLPEVRLRAARPFTSTSIDFAGPFIGKPHKRSHVRCKLYLCMFVCLVTKAVHLEVVSDLTTPGFLAAFQRFTARRGLCQHVYSDQGTNFIGAAGELKQMVKLLRSAEHQETVTNYSTSLGITWHFQPPAAPHFGGLHEAAIKSAKFHIRRVVGKQVLTYEEFTTLFARAEAILNSRPLCPLSEDPSEVDVLTPGHFLIGGPLLALPDSNVTNISLQTRYRLLTDLTRHFWQRWRREYLHTIIQRSKWFKCTENVKDGQMVLLQDDNLPPQEWKVARIKRVIPGRDGAVRVVIVRTTSGDLTRPAIKVFPLPSN